MKDNMKRSLPLIILAVFLAVFMVVVFQLYRAEDPPGVTSEVQEQPVDTAEVTEPRVFPDRLGDLELVAQIEGGEAELLLAQLHGQVIPVKEAFILVYENDEGEVTAWISVSETAEEAEDMTLRMTEILPRLGIYTAAEEEKLNDTTVYTTRHVETGVFSVYYQAEEQVIWLESELSEADTLELVAQKIDGF